MGFKCVVIFYIRKMNKHKRMENKKRKTAALVNIIKINEKDKKTEEQPLENDVNEVKEKDSVRLASTIITN